MRPVCRVCRKNQAEPAGWTKKDGTPAYRYRCSTCRKAGRRAAMILGALLLAGCASGPPTIELDARAFVQTYIQERDRFVRQTAPAFKKCEALAPLTSETTKAKCARLQTEQALWASRDAVILNAILTRSAISAETWAAVWSVAQMVLTVAADIAL